jgi:hypothetical protein
MIGSRDTDDQRTHALRMQRHGPERLGCADAPRPRHQSDPGPLAIAGVRDRRASAMKRELAQASTGVEMGPRGAGGGDPCA